MAKYVVLPELTLYHSDARQYPLNSPFGVNMKDSNNVAYQIHQLPYGTYQRLSGISMKVPPNTPKAGVLSLYIDNATTGQPNNTYSYTVTTADATSVVFYVKPVEMLIVGPGLWDFYGNMYDQPNDTYYIFTTKNATMQLP